MDHIRAAVLLRFTSCHHKKDDKIKFYTWKCFNFSTFWLNLSYRRFVNYSDTINVNSFRLFNLLKMCWPRKMHVVIENRIDKNWWLDDERKKKYVYNVDVSVNPETEIWVREHRTVQGAIVEGRSPKDMGEVWKRTFSVL